MLLDQGSDSGNLKTLNFKKPTLITIHLQSNRCSFIMQVSQTVEVCTKNHSAITFLLESWLSACPVLRIWWYILWKYLNRTFPIPVTILKVFPSLIIWRVCLPGWFRYFSTEPFGSTISFPTDTRVPGGFCQLRGCCPLVKKWSCCWFLTPGDEQRWLYSECCGLIY